MSVSQQLEGTAIGQSSEEHEEGNSSHSQEDSSSMQQEGGKKKNLNSKPRDLTSYISIKPPTGEWPINGVEVYVKYPFSTQMEKIEDCNLKMSRVKFIQSKEEKEMKRRHYRAEYMQKDYVIEKSRMRQKDPEVIKKRKEYAAREDVKRQKKETSANTRALRKELKVTNPDLYKTLMDKIEVKKAYKRKHEEAQL